MADKSMDEHIAEWRAAGLTADEALLIAARRRRGLDAPATATSAEFPIVLGLAVAAAVAVKVPALFGFPINPNQEVQPFYLHNAALFVFPLLAIYFVWKRGWTAMSALWLVLPFVAGAVFANAYPWKTAVIDNGPRGRDTEVLTVLHLPIALWLAVGIAYARGRWFRGGERMNFVRFSGELAIYYALIAFGGGVLIAFTAMLFLAIDVKPDVFIGGWLLPCGMAGAVIIGSWLVEAKQSVIGNMAPVLTRLFTPLFTLLLLAFLVTMAWTGNPVNVKREVLIGFDLLLAVIVGLVLYAASARDPHAPANFFDGMQLVLAVSALVVDGVALWAIAARISEFGFTPNRVAALGENLILLVNLAWTAWLYASFLRRRGSFTALERWQIAYLPVYPAWAALVVVVFPPMFGVPMKHFLFLSAVVMLAQPPLPSFEVASVKRNMSGDSRAPMRTQPGGRLIVTNARVKVLIAVAFSMADPESMMDSRVLGGPDWIGSERYDINAKSSTEFRLSPDGPDPQMIQMVRSLLQERFKLRSHRETRELPVYELVLARADRRLGPEMRTPAADCEAAIASGIRPPRQPGEPPPCGLMGGPARTIAGGATMQQLVANLSNRVDRLVVDKTGLTGRFAFTLVWTPDRIPAEAPPPGIPPIDPNGPSIFTALQEQLGLKLEPAKAPMDVIVIDSVEHPTED